MENKKMSCWDFVFSSVKTHIDDLVRQADKYTKDMNEDFEHFFCWYAEDMYKTQRELSCYRALKVVLSAGSHDDVKLYMESKINSLTDSLLTGSIRKNSTSAASNLAHTLELEVNQKIREKFTILLGIIEKGEKVEVLSNEGDWTRIKYNGKTGYVATRFLSEKNVYDEKRIIITRIH